MPHDAFQCSGSDAGNVVGDRGRRGDADGSGGQAGQEEVHLVVSGVECLGGEVLEVGRMLVHQGSMVRQRPGGGGGRQGRLFVPRCSSDGSGSNQTMNATPPDGHFMAVHAYQKQPDGDPH